MMTMIKLDRLDSEIKFIENIDSKSLERSIDVD